jgi:UDP-N-acetylglucosamine 2-epimerase
MKPTLSLAIIYGARPNFMKIAPMVQALQERKADAAA